MDGDPLVWPSEARTRAARSSGVSRPLERRQRLGRRVGRLGADLDALGDLLLADRGGLGLGTRDSLGHATARQGVVGGLVDLHISHRRSPSILCRPGGGPDGLPYWSLRHDRC
jgi:hypothetical protein